MTDEERKQISKIIESTQSKLNDEEMSYIINVCYWLKEFQERIDKAIAYMDNTYDINNIKELFEHYNKVEEILLGSDKNENTIR